MVEPKLALLEMQIKSGLGQTSKLCKAHFSDAPKVFDTVNMRYFISEFIVSMLDSIMLFITQVYQTVIAFPAIGVDRALKSTLPRITACNVALEQLGTIFVYTLPLHFNRDQVNRFLEFVN